MVVFAALQLLSAFVFSELLPIDYGVAFCASTVTPFEPLGRLTSPAS